MRRDGRGRSVACCADRLAGGTRSVRRRRRTGLAAASSSRCPSERGRPRRGRRALRGRGVREATDMDEDSLSREGRRLAGRRDRAHRTPSTPSVAEDLLDDGVRPDLDLLCSPNTRRPYVSCPLRVSSASTSTTLHVVVRRARAPRGGPSLRRRRSRQRLPRYRGPSQLAQWLRPFPSNSFSRGRPSLRGLDPVATMTAPATISPESVDDGPAAVYAVRPVGPRSARTTTPAAAACSWSLGPSSNPGTPSGKPGKSSTRSVLRIAPPEPRGSSRIVLRPCRAAKSAAVRPAGPPPATAISQSVRHVRDLRSRLAILS